MAETRRSEGQESFPQLLKELSELAQAYVMQRTVAPVKGLLRYIALGLAGSLALGAGLVILGLGLLRALQTQTGATFHGSFSWLPYVLTAAALFVVVAMAMGAALKGRKKK